MKKEWERQERRQERRRLEEEALSKIRQLAQDNPGHLMRLFATAAAGVPVSVLDPSAGPDDPHPFAHYFHRPPGRPPFERDLGILFCIKYGYIDFVRSAGDLIPLTEFVVDSFSGWKDVDFQRTRFQDDNLVPHDAFDEPSQLFALAIAEVARAVYQGLPLIRLAGDQQQLIVEPEPLYSYLSLRWKYFDFSRQYKWPEWIQGLYFKRDHLEASKLFFGGGEELDDAQVEARRSAFRARIGIREPVPQPTSTPTRLLGLVQAVRERYYGVNFSVDDPDTWPKQADIVSWLMSQFALSKRLAEAVELVACPDEVRQRR